jgi:hypothetical protein
MLLPTIQPPRGLVQHSSVHPEPVTSSQHPASHSGIAGDAAAGASTFELAAAISAIAVQIISLSP